MHRRAAAGDDPARFAIEPVRRIGLLPVGIAMALRESPGQGTYVVPGRRVERQARGLVDNQQRLVLLKNGNLRRPSRIARAPLAPREPEAGPIPGCPPQLRLVLDE